ncbi:MAG: hypothetical protein CL797_08570 [Chromatiales bacterium]|nr:hypothetical protein [Chromatiales bacterium]
MTAPTTTHIIVAMINSRHCYFMKHLLRSEQLFITENIFDIGEPHLMSDNKCSRQAAPKSGTGMFR